jgi:hypothetical protein
VIEYFAQTLTITNKMKAHEEKIGQVVIIEKILRLMTSRFDHIVCLVEESTDLDMLIIDELQNNLLVNEQRLNNHGGGDEQALKISHEEKFGGREVIEEVVEGGNHSTGQL